MKTEKCCVCNGNGFVSKPPFIAGDQMEWIGDSCIWTCQKCSGTGIIYIITKEVKYDCVEVFYD